MLNAILLLVDSLSFGSISQIFIIIGTALAIFGLLFWPLSYLIASKCVYDATLRRKTPDKWARELQSHDPLSVQMDEEGMAWHEKFLEFKKDAHITRDGIDLYGEYYDFGHDRSVFILSGRTESLRYGYYFAIPYAEAGWNVLVVDPRAHGLSGGEFNTVGFEESRDQLAWARYLHDEEGVRQVLFHGICIGAAGGTLALTSEDCPDYIVGIVADGMFANFGESMKNHLIERKKPVFMFYGMIDMWMKHYTGHSMSYGPIDVIHKQNRPMLMLYSREDPYSVPAFAQKLYDKLGTDKKQLVWFPHGAHSMLRVTDTERYDNAIKAFLNQYFSKNKTEKENDYVL